MPLVAVCLPAAAAPASATRSRSVDSAGSPPRRTLPTGSPQILPSAPAGVLAPPKWLSPHAVAFSPGRPAFAPAHKRSFGALQREEVQAYLSVHTAVRHRPKALSLLRLAQGEVLMGPARECGAFAKIRPALWRHESDEHQVRLAIRETRAAPPTPKKGRGQPSGWPPVAARTTFVADEAQRKARLWMQLEVPRVGGLGVPAHATGSSHKSDYTLLDWHDIDAMDASMVLTGSERETFVFALFDQVLPLLAQSHAKGALVGDVSLTNIMLDLRQARFCLVDFENGDVQAKPHPLHAGLFRPSFPPPEALAHDCVAPSAAADVWALGAAAITLLGQSDAPDEPYPLSPFDGAEPAWSAYPQYYALRMPSTHESANALQAPEAALLHWHHYLARAHRRSAKATVFALNVLLQPQPQKRAAASQAAMVLQMPQLLGDSVQRDTLCVAWLALCERLAGLFQGGIDREFAALSAARALLGRRGMRWLDEEEGAAAC